MSDSRLGYKPTSSPCPRSSLTYGHRFVRFSHSQNSPCVGFCETCSLECTRHEINIYTLSTSLSPVHDLTQLPPLHLVCVRLESPQYLPLCLSELRHLLPSIPLRPLFIPYNKKKISSTQVHGFLPQPNLVHPRIRRDICIFTIVCLTVD